ncbi:hypothetical protein H2200_000223 [Cladophialophora chaetospira]|uniref:Uncharacterized protein n=1 Tax=Cladophialophora chaetospira TaxID=386627 RepID=A0AA38XN48_9EURO|nr:hypothetical protein H2200_000223 [Cladophialophora chaetospira]
MPIFAQDEGLAPVPFFALKSGEVDGGGADGSKEPQLVCFALTNKRHYSLVLACFEATRLNQICPKDVRERFPAELEEYMYNIMVSPQSKRGCRFGWDLDNFVKTPAWARASYYPHIEDCRIERYMTTEENLSFIRQVTWLENGANVKAALDRTLPHPTELKKVTNLPLAMLFFNRDASENETFYCDVAGLLQESITREYAGSLKKGRLENELLPDRLLILDSLWQLWNQPVLHSVEYLVLKDLLTCWEKHKTLQT